MQRNNRRQLKQRRRQLRNDPTAAEKLLWLYLKESQCEGRKFRRQHSYGPYIMDFYCPSERLCIELDGDSHSTSESQAHDTAKDLYLQRHHIKVIRFTNEEVYASVEKVLEKVLYSMSPSVRKVVGEMGDKDGASGEAENS
jgi:very-short-patch-repair endonuclease